MKKLISILGLVGAITFPTLAYAQSAETPKSEEKKSTERYINKRDVPIPDFFKPYTEEVQDNMKIHCYKVDEFGRVCYLRTIEGYLMNGDGKPVPIVGWPSMISIDLNENNVFDDEEFFWVDYSNSQPTNPIEEYKKKKSESPKTETPKTMIPQEFSGEKKST